MNIKRGVKYGLLTYTLLKAGRFVLHLRQKQEETIRRLEDKIKFLKSYYVPLKFKIISRSGDNFIISLKFLTKNGTAIRINGYDYVHFKVSGSQPAFDFAMVKLGEGYLAFPWLLFSDAVASSKGINLFKYYTGKDGEPLIYYPFASEDEKQAFIDVFARVKKGQADWGSMVTSAADVSHSWAFQTGRVYKIVVHTRGGIEILED